MNQNIHDQMHKSVQNCEVYSNNKESHQQYAKYIETHNKSMTENLETLGQNFILHSRLN